jgi:hypothetical protein
MRLTTSHHHKHHLQQDYDSASITASLDKLSVSITDTDLSPLLQETFDSQLRYDTAPVQQGRNNPSSPQSAHMPIITKHVDNKND